jgi:outer membrane receptor protein involved in Fe transport
VEVSDGFNVDLDGNSLPNAPENTFHLGAAYTWQIDQIAGALTARWDYSWRDDQYAREFNTKGDFIEAWFQHNAALIYESNDGHWEGRLWIRNILNDDNITGKYLTSDTSGFFRNYFLTEPRLFGASLKYSFGEQ